MKYLKITISIFGRLHMKSLINISLLLVVACKFCSLKGRTNIPIKDLQLR